MNESSVSLIYKLRKEGKLDEALDLANDLFLLHPKNLSVQTAKAWIIYDILKSESNTVNLNTVTNLLSQLSNLKLDNSLELLFNQVAFQIGKLLFTAERKGVANNHLKNKIFETIKSLHITRPSSAHSFILKAFLKSGEAWPKFFQFLDWWGLENLRPEDYTPERFNDREIPALAERTFAKYASALLNQSDSNASQGYPIDTDRIRGLIGLLDTLLIEHPEFKFTRYYKTKLQLLLGVSKDETIHDFIPFVQSNFTEFWVWQLLGEIHADNPGMELSCYCKALSCNSPSGFLVKVREKFIDTLLKLNYFNEAKNELDILIRTREKNGWSVPGKILSLKNAEWYQNATAAQNSQSFYVQNKDLAEDLVFGNLPKKLVVVEHVDTQKNIVHFVENKKSKGRFKSREKSVKLHPGKVLEIRVAKDKKPGFFKLLTLNEVDSNVSCPCMKTFEGKFSKNENAHFAMVRDVYVPLKLCNPKLVNGTDVTGIAVISFNRSKNSWGWRAVTLSAS